MVDSSAGKKLSQARLAKRLTIDEVAHATKLRPDKIVALENDDFSRFGSIAYGKGFLQIYARYLGIDLTEHLRHLEIPDNTVSISDYQYLNTPRPPEPKQRDRSLERGGARRERRPPSVLPLVVVLGLGALCIVGYFKLTAAHLPVTAVPAAATPEPTEAVLPTAPPPQPAAPAVDVKPGSLASKVPALASHVSARPEGDAAFLAKNASPAAATPALKAPSATVKPASATVKAPPADPEDTGVTNELIVEPLKKTWVTIHKNSPDSPPIFEDYLYPGVRPLKLRGAKFFVKVRDESAVQIRMNGHPIAYQPPGISIQ